MDYLRLFVVVMGLTNTMVVCAQADAFDDGLSAAKNGDYTTAYTKWASLADQGNVHAQFNLGLMYARGNGVARDYGKALSFYRRAAAQGYPEAQLNIGVMYTTGQGVDVDFAEAANWLSMAAAQGVAKAQFNLATMYAQGKGVPKDRVLAYVYYALAEAHGYDHAVVAHEKLAADLSAAELEEGRTLAARWRIGRPLPGRLSASR